MKKIILFIAAVIILGGGWFGWEHYKNADTANSGGQPVEHLIKRGTIQSIVTAQGKLEPKNYVAVGAQVSGEIINLHVEIGDTVKTGDLIAEIDPDVYDAQVKSSEAQLKMLDAQKAQQEALKKQAQWKYERNERLYKDKAVSKESYEDSQISLEIAAANLLSIEAQIEQAQSRLDENKTNLNYTKIYAPMGGTVVDQAVEEGETINANQTTPTIVQVANLDIMTAKAEVAEADIMKLSEGTSVYFTTLGSGDRRWEGTVRQILPTPKEINDVVLYNVLVDVQNTDRTLLPGMTTQMFFILEQAENVPLVPVNALGRRIRDADTSHGQAYELRIKTPAGFETRTAIIGLTSRTEAAVIDGAQDGETVIIPPRISAQQNTGRVPRMRL